MLKNSDHESVVKKRPSTHLSAQGLQNPEAFTAEGLEPD